MTQSLRMTPPETTSPPAAPAAAPAVLRATITVTRAATGKVETFQLVGTPVEPASDHKEP